MQPFTLMEFAGKRFLDWAVCKSLFSVIALTGMGMLFAFSLKIAFIGAVGFVLMLTAIVMQLLNDRGELHQRRGRKDRCDLLFEDLLIVPLLALVAFMAPNQAAESSSIHLQGIWHRTVGHRWINCCRALVTQSII